MAVRYDPILNDLLLKYVKTTGDTMTGTLNINTSATDGKGININATGTGSPYGGYFKVSGAHTLGDFVTGAYADMSVTNAEFVTGFGTSALTATSEAYGFSVGQITNTGASTTAYGFYLTGISGCNLAIGFQLPSLSSNVLQYGFSVSMTNTSATQRSFGSYVSILGTNSANSKNYGFYLAAVGVTGTNTENYGIYIDSISGATTNYGIYLNTTAQSYFAGKLGINSATPTAQLDVIPSSSTTKGIIIKAAASQSVNLTEWQNSSAAVLASVGSAGAFTMPSATITDTTGNALIVDTNVLVVDASNNRVGVNTASPASTLDVVSALSTTQSGLNITGTNSAIAGATGQIYLSKLAMTLTPAAASFIDYFGLNYALIQSQGSSNGMVGMNFYVGAQGSSSPFGLTGFRISVETQSSSGASSAIGARFSFAHGSSNSIATFTGVWMEAPSRTGAGSISTLYQILIDYADVSSTQYAIFSNGLNQFVAGKAAQVAGVFKGFASQSTDIFQIQKSDATIYAKFDSIGRLGLQMGATGLTAYLHLAGGTASASTAPLKFTSGTNLTTAEAGAMEYDGNRLYHTNATAIREALAGCIFTQTADKTVTNTVSETTIIGTGVGTLTLPANFFVAGKTIRLRIGGIYSTPALSTPSVVINIKYGSTVLATVTTTGLLAGASALKFEGEVLITCRTTGATGTVMTHGDIEYSTGVAGTVNIDTLNNGGAATTIDTTASSLLDVTVTWDTATTTRIATSIVTTVEVVN